MNVFKLREHLERINISEVLRNRTISSSLLLKRVVKPKLLFLERDYTPVWFYVGVRDYVVIPKTYCSCMDFVVNVMSRKSKLVCRHLLIQYISEKTNTYREVRVNDNEELSRIISEVININISPTLRKLLFRRGD